MAGPNPFLAILGGVAAMLLGAVIWAAISLGADMQIGWMAIGIGFVVGVAVRLLGRSNGAGYGLLAAALSFIGVMLGNIFLFATIIARKESDPVLGTLLALLGHPDDLLDLFLATFGPIDLLFYGLSIYVGYRTVTQLGSVPIARTNAVQAPQARQVLLPPPPPPAPPPIAAPLPPPIAAPLPPPIPVPIAPPTRAARPSVTQPRLLMAVAAGAVVVILGVVAFLLAGPLRPGGGPPLSPAPNKTATAAPTSSASSARPSATAGVPLVETNISYPAQNADGSLGRSDAPVTVTVWGDYQCPPCRDFALQVEPALVSSRVLAGDVRLVDRSAAILGPPSVTGAVAASCALQQGLGWQFRAALYANQPAEQRGQVTAEFLDLLGRIADAVGLDRTEFEACMSSNATLAQVEADRTIATDLGIRSVPTAVVGERQLVGPTWVELETAIEAALDATATPGATVSVAFGAPGDTAAGLAWDGSSLWFTSSYELYQVDVDGSIQGVFTPPEVTPEGLAWDGDAFWMFTTNYGEIYRFSLDTSRPAAHPATLASFESPYSVIGVNHPLAWDGAKLWFAEKHWLYRLDTSGQVEATLTVGEPIAGLSWDGEVLWVAHDAGIGDAAATLVTLDTQGNVLSSYAIPPLRHVTALTWADGQLFVAGGEYLGDHPTVYRVNLPALP